MKKYYSPTKPYYKRKRLHIILKLFKKCLFFIKKDEIVWKTERPIEPVVFISNHTKVHAPFNFILFFKPEVRLWANCYYLDMKECREFLRRKFLKVKNIVIRCLVTLAIPLLVAIFRSIEPIPVYHDMRIRKTFDKSIETLEEKKSIIIFPERTENQVNKYIYQLNRGFPHMAQAYYRKTDKKIKFYPVYTCKDLHKIIIGEPIEYNPDMNIVEQREKICLYIEDKIRELGDSLPEHKLELYDF
jgi:hypothetical protein